MTDARTRYELHEHSILTSRHSPGEKVVHAHADGSAPHRHPDTGPATYGRAKGRRYRAKPHGAQLPSIEPTEEERSFTVVFVDGYTPAHAAAGITPERYEAERAAFLAAVEAEAAPSSAAERMIETFRLAVRYEYVAPPADEPDTLDLAAEAAGG